MISQQIIVTTDLSIVTHQVETLKGLAQRLPDGIRDEFLSRIANLCDLGLKAKSVPTGRAGGYVVSFWSIALAELCVSAARTLDGDISDVSDVISHGDSVCEGNQGSKSDSNAYGIPAKLEVKA